MKNLQQNNVSARPQFGGNAKNVCCGFDAIEELVVVYVCDDNLKITKESLDYSCGRNQNPKYWSETLSLPDADAEVIDMTYLSLPGVVAVGLSSGEIWTLQGDTGKMEEAGTCAGGLTAMQWSPDQELVVLITNENQMILMSYLLDPIAERNLADEEFGEKGFITVGWGKKETQFHGSEGKEAAKAKVEIVVGKESNIEKTPRITWRGDGQMYAVGTVVNGIRIFKVFDRDGHLQYTSEIQIGLEANLSWRPSGNVIATTQKLPNKYVVAFFEKNGLKHGEFTIPINNDTSVVDLFWSSDSEILALQCYDCVQDANFVLLFTSSNYHWYLKQTLTFSEKILKIFWDNLWDQDANLDFSKKLHIFLKDGKYYSYNWKWNVDHSRGKDKTDDAVVAVIDGNKLLLTAFRHAIVPPPMSAFQIETKQNINSTFFGPPDSNLWNSNSVCIVTDSNELIFYKQTSKVPLKYELAGFVNVGSDRYQLSKYNWVWLNANTIICIKYEDTEYSCNVQEYELNIGETFELKLRHSTTLKSQLFLALHPHPSDNSKVFILTQSQILEYSLGGELKENILSIRPGTIEFRVSDIDNQLYFYTLTHKNNLSVNDHQNVINNVSSIFVQSHFLLLTTLQHELICTHLSKSAMDALLDTTKLTNSSQIYKRNIERGAKLVVVVPCDTRTVFQLPRGNLETIQPRPLSLKIIGEYLDQCKYHSAFDLMRKQRINLNLIHDHNPEHFLKNTETFLTEIKNPSWLSLFISDLDNVDVTMTMYASSYTAKSPTNDDVISCKISTICETLRESLLKRTDVEERILPILTSYVKKNTIDDLEKALTVVKELKEKEIEGVKPIIGSDEALRYLLYLVDVNYLYDIALGMYDFDLVLLVANKSQKDPKEYVPMLNEFNEMDQDYKKFSINKYLKRFTRAVKCLADCGPSHYDELRTFVKYHSLFRDALELFEPTDEIYRQIAEDYGLHLKLKKHFTEAGFAYKRGGNVNKAVECFKEALQWELCLETASSGPKDMFKQLCLELVSALREEKRHSEAIIILEQYCDDGLDTIKYAVECGQYKTALRLCQKHGKGELTESLIKPALLEEYNNVLATVKFNGETFTQHKSRLTTVRANKQAKGDCPDVEYLPKDSDLYSDAGSTIASTGSRGSSRSFKSSKNRRKHERKLISLKEGSQYEDVALVTALHTLISNSFEMRNLVKEVNLALCWFSKDQLAMDLQNNLETVLKSMKDSFKEIWTNEFMLEATSAAIAASLDTEGVPQGIAALDVHLRIPPVIQDVTWKLTGI